MRCDWTSMRTPWRLRRACWSAFTPSRRKGLTKYPEREPVERIVAAHLGLGGKQVLLTNGVDEAIHLVCVAFLDEGDEALICTPSFFMYDVSIELMTGGGLRKVQADETFAFPFERFLAAITPKTKLIIVASPNNPTGTVVSREHLLANCCGRSARAS